ncbi:MAG: aminoglycoside phosphotransferase family protein [Chloroflexota bacterium]|nr:aminoglycoside phosphotransferase family protein [Chloroflexota bacterium]
MYTQILQQFGTTSAALLGKGGESSVYALDQTRVVRIYGRGASLAYLQARTDFYTQLATRQPPFAIPLVLDYGVIDGHLYTIERRMRGHDFAHILPQLMGRDRDRALISYLNASAQIGTITFPDALFGEMLLPHAPLQRHTWPQYLWDRVQQTLSTSRDDLVQDVPQLERLLTEFHTRVLRSLAIPTKALVHGDYFPGNVFIDDTLTVYGVGDFGYSTVVGDPQMDVAGAVIFLEVVSGYQETDTQLLLHYLQAQSYNVSADSIDLYRIYYSLYFSFCKRSEPNLYVWCVQNLRRYTHRLP